MLTGGSTFNLRHRVLVQYSTVQYSIVQYSTILSCGRPGYVLVQIADTNRRSRKEGEVRFDCRGPCVLYCTVHYSLCIVQYITVSVYSTLQYMYCVVHYRICVLYSALLYLCIIQYITVSVYCTV